MTDIRFGFQAAAAGDGTESDQKLYQDLLDDCALGSRLGYDAAWLLEHHFSDYYPTPSPLLLMAHIAARFPELSLGTSVLVLPWYHPLRLAEEISMLNSLTRGTLHLGIGRGTARMEYDAYGVDMNEGRARFAEIFEVVEQGLSGREFTHRGTFWNIDRPIRLRPEPIKKPVKFYGAIGSPASAEVMGDLGIAPICLSTFPDGLLAKILERWRARAGNKADGDPAHFGQALHRRYRPRGARTWTALLPRLLRATGGSLRSRRQTLDRHSRIRRLQPDVRELAQVDGSRKPRSVSGFQSGRQRRHHLPPH
jgi:alkanesulfonate monooxygenase SsuD/methylene tetrahydromethanopterin reductase-like flavin-dependent oxidoreductase (luciferase family)